MKANGKFTSGMASIGNRKYDTAPITMSANIIMVQNTGFLTATRVIHIAVLRNYLDAVAGGAVAAGAGAGEAPGIATD